MAASKMGHSRFKSRDAVVAFWPLHLFEPLRQIRAKVTPYRRAEERARLRPLSDLQIFIVLLGNTSGPRSNSYGTAQTTLLYLLIITAPTNTWLSWRLQLPSHPETACLDVRGRRSAPPGLPAAVMGVNMLNRTTERAEWPDGSIIAPNAISARWTRAIGSPR
ncbi:hypothetical protein B0H14DRAFT_2644372 [Mycena olivaceomarginata]|nr:hypothetical protein B0H14DRAFT_2644372 [Mycena olivaceomarginata]